jgi:hypothetical protein
MDTLDLRQPLKKLGGHRATHMLSACMLWVAVFRFGGQSTAV